MSYLRFFSWCISLTVALTVPSAVRTLCAHGNPPPAGPPVSEPVSANDNTRAAGTTADGVVTLKLRAAAGMWRPEGDGGPSLSIEAFGETGAMLTVPAPLIRVQEGTTIALSVSNELTSPLRVNGLCTRDGSPCAPIDVAPGATREVRFAAGRAGTYHYWATTIGAPVPFRELAGAFVVDPCCRTADPDRIFVITEWSNLTGGQLRDIFTADDANARFLAARPVVAFMVNGRAWPATERLTYRQGDPVRWRVVNLSSQTHPMHLHGFYFTVTDLGDGRRDDAVASGEGRRVVTQLLPSGGTMAMTWVPERAGNWLFHCHVMLHVAPERRLAADGSGQAVGAPHAVPAAGHAAHAEHAGHDASLGMSGMVLGITVTPRADAPGAAPAGREPAGASSPLVAPRRLTLDIHAGSDDGRAPAGITVSEADGPEPSAARAVPDGPQPVVLRRGEPVEITLVNHLSEPTSMHWHGLELDSVYDGVHGWSGQGSERAPMIAPGGTFVVRLTPPHAGTFIYHTHVHDYRQLTSGLYGPLLVLEPGERWDPATDHAIILGRRDADETASILRDPASAVINGIHDPHWAWKAGSRHRVRLINITPDDIWTVSLQGTDATATWQPLTKDGAPVPSSEAQPGSARVTIGVGETYDFAFDAPPGRRTMFLEARGTEGTWQSQARIQLQ